MKNQIHDKVFLCRCEKVTREEIEAAIRDGATTLSGVKKRTHTGMGPCQGRTCRRLISELLRQKKSPDQLLRLNDPSQSRRRGELRKRAILRRYSRQPRLRSWVEVRWL